jgi:pyruvyl transferase EpsO
MMNFYHKCEELRRIIKDTVSPYINQKCCLLGLPYYHKNVGDFLIWQGVELFLKELAIPCVYRASCVTYQKRNIPENTILLLNGGGDFGDTWAEVQEFRRQIINEFPDHKIIILPQTVYYSDTDKLLEDAKLFSCHNNLTICARDNTSFQILKKYFYANNILLVPDMAFYIPYGLAQKKSAENTDKILLLKRKDKEFNASINYSGLPSENTEVKEWPSIDNPMFSFFLLRVLLSLNRRISFFSKILNIYALFCYKQIIINSGIKFFSKYNKVFTTRLHGAILCCLLGKSFVLLNNSYGKNRVFFETWFNDLDDAKFYV